MRNAETRVKQWRNQGLNRLLRFVQADLRGTLHSPRSRQVDFDYTFAFHLPEISEKIIEINNNICDDVTHVRILLSTATRARALR